MAKKPDLRILGLGDAQLMGRLKKAAEAAGVNTVEELVDLVVDSGVSARPPVDNLTERFSLEDLGARLHTVAVTQPRSKRAEWFQKLVQTQKIAVVTTLRHRGYSPLSISNDFGISEMEVERIYSKNRTELGSQVMGIRLDTLVGRIWAAKERAQEGAMLKKDWATYWRIEDGSTKLLQELDIVRRATHKVEVVDQAEGVKAAALARLVSLAEKKALRLKEIAAVDAEVVQALPADVEAGYRELKDADV